MVMVCSGASNVGQLTNEAAKVLDAEQTARFYCLAGPGGHVDSMVDTVKAAEKVLVVDGCPVACAKLIADAAGIENYEYVIVTDLGIAKNRDFDLPQADVERVVSACRSKIG